MQLIDYILFFGYLVVIVIAGTACFRRRASLAELFSASGSMRWFPVGISVMVSLFSAVNYVAFPSEVARHGVYVLACLPAFVLAAIPVARYLLPMYRSSGGINAYGILERRFDGRVRVMAGLIFVAWRVLWMGAALHASAWVLSMLTGVNYAFLMLLAAGAAVLYTALGGIRAVIWTDVAQFFVLVGALVLGTVLASVRSSVGFSGLLAEAFRAGSIRPVVPFDQEFFSLDPTVRITFWSALFGSVVAFVSRYGADQMVIQRYMCARSDRDAVAGLWLNVLCMVAVLLLLALFGVIMKGSVLLSGHGNAQGGMAVFIGFIKSLPPGMTGLTGAGLLAATMSSVDSGVNACCSVCISDFRIGKACAPLQTGEDVKQKANRSLVVTASAILGIAAVGLGFLLGRMGELFVVVNRVVNGMGAPLLALIAVGLGWKRANATGCLVGGIAGVLVSMAVSLGVDHMALHYYAVVNFLVTFLACIVASELAHKSGS